MAVRDNWQVRMKKLALDRLEEQVNALYRQGRYAEAAGAAEKAARAAAEIFGDNHSYTKACRNNLALMERVVANGGPPARPVGRTAGDQAVQAGSVRRKLTVGLALMMLAVFLGTAGFVGKYRASGPAETSAAVASAFEGSESRPYYKVQASFDPRQRTVEGQEEVTFELREPVTEILFNLYFNRYRNSDLNASEIRRYAFTRGKDQGYIEVQWVSYQGRPLPFRQQGELLRISQADTSFAAGEHSLKIGFKVRVPAIADRSGANSHGMWLGHWLPVLRVETGARRPTEIGDPFVGLSATYEVEFAVPSEYSLVLSNIDSIDRQGEMQVYRGRLERVRDLPVFINEGYRLAAANVGGTVINYYYLSPDSRPQEVLAAAGRAVRYFSAKFGKYPWNQLNIVENDMFLNGMEYSTMVLVSAKAIRSGMQETVFHEVAHQWFYNIVGSDQYNAAFIDEGMVEFLVSQALGRLTPAYHRDIAGLSRNLGEFSSWQEYRTVHYKNGKRLFEDIYVLLGKNEFESFLKEYYDRYKFGLVTAGEFKILLAGRIGEQAAGRLLGR